MGLACAYLTAPIINLLFAWGYIHRNLFPVRVGGNWGCYKNLLRQSKSLGLQQILSNIQERIELLLIPKMVGITVFGYFSAGTIPASRLSIIPDGLATAAYPEIARKSRGSFFEGHKVVQSLLTNSLLVCLPLALLLSYFAAPIALVLFPRHGLMCQITIQITAWLFPLLGIYLPMNYALQAVGQHKPASLAVIKAMFCGTLLSICLIAWYGVNGANWSFVCRPAISILFLAPLFREYFAGVFQALPWGKIGLCNGLMGGILWSAPLLHLPAEVTIVGSSVVAIGVYLVALKLLRIIETPS
jgi:O-antigen/teichoic acid export membrane protein